jgi:hypothetical protein
MPSSFTSEDTMSDLHASRYNIYNDIHKALRFFMGDTLHRAARMDAGDDADVAAGLGQVRELLAVLDGHLRHEGQFVHAAMEARRPGSSTGTEHEHGEHRAAIDALHALCTRVAATAGHVRAVHIGHLQRALSVFIGENYVHMNQEETDNNAVLWQHYTDEELLGIEHAIVATIAPEENAALMKWMLPALNPAERANLLRGMRAHAPAPVFDGVFGMARQLLDERDGRKLALALAA